MLTRVMTSQIQTVTHWKVLLTLALSQQLGTASCVQIPMRRPSTLPAKHSGRKCGPLAALLRVAYGWRPSWNGLVIVTKLYGRATMRSSRQSGSSLSRKITIPLKETRWQTGLNNCFESKKLHTWKSTHMNQRQGSKGEEDPCAVFKAVPCTLLLTVQKGCNLCHGQLAGIAFRQCFQAP